MKWAVIIFTILTALFVVATVRAEANVAHAEDNWNVVFMGTAAFVCGIVDFILIIVWLTIT